MGLCHGVRDTFWLVPLGFTRAVFRWRTSDDFFSKWSWNRRKFIFEAESKYFLVSDGRWNSYLSESERKKKFTMFIICIKVQMNSRDLTLKFFWFFQCFLYNIHQSKQCFIFIFQRTGRSNRETLSCELCQSRNSESFRQFTINKCSWF